MGAWSFNAPRLKLLRSGSAIGSTAARFEFLAVLYGLEEMLAVDSSGLSVHVFSDCDSTVAAINCLRDGKPLKRPSRYQDRLDLLPRLVSVLERRTVYVTRATGGNANHRVCHRTARRRLKEEIAKDPKVNYVLALTRQHARMADLIKERDRLLSRLTTIDAQMLVAPAKVEALESLLKTLDFQPACGWEQIPSLVCEDEAVCSMVRCRYFPSDPSSVR